MKMRSTKYRHFIRVIGFFAACFALVALPVFGQDAFESEEDLKKGAESYFEAGQYDEAKPLYSRLLSLYPTDGNYNYRYGACVLFTESNKDDAMRYVAFAVKQDGVDPAAFFFYGKALHLNYRFNDALVAYKQFKEQATEKSPWSKEVDQHIQMCQNGKSLLRTISDMVVYEKSEYGESDYFRSYDLTDFGGKLVSVLDDFMSEEDKKREFSSIMYLRPGSNRLFFSSYGADGSGGRDIYYVQQDGNGEYGDPISIGEVINTSYDEDFPFYHPEENALYFASKGHNSMGGYDIFKSTYDVSSGAWGAPQNLDYAVNTPDDDFLFITDKSSKKAYFSSKRESKYGKVAVYQVGVSTVSGQLVAIKGKFSTAGSLSTKISIKRSGSDKVLNIVNTDPSDGSYNITLPQGQKFVFVVEAEASQMVHTGEVMIPKLDRARPLKQEMSLEVAEEGEKLLINNLFDEVLADQDGPMYTAEELKRRASLAVNYEDQPVPEEAPPAEEAPLVSIADPVDSAATEGVDQGSELAQQAETQMNSITERKESLSTLQAKAYAVAEEKQQAYQEKVVAWEAAKSSSGDPASAEGQTPVDAAATEMIAAEREFSAAIALAGEIDRSLAKTEKALTKATPLSQSIQSGNCTDQQVNDLRLLSEQLKSDDLGVLAADASTFSADDAAKQLASQKKKVKGLEEDLLVANQDIEYLKEQAEQSKDKEMVALFTEQVEQQEKEKQDLATKIEAERGKIAQFEGQVREATIRGEAISPLVAELEAKEAIPVAPDRVAQLKALAKEAVEQTLPIKASQQGDLAQNTLVSDDGESSTPDSPIEVIEGDTTSAAPVALNDGAAQSSGSEQGFPTETAATTGIDSADVSVAITTQTADAEGDNAVAEQVNATQAEADGSEVASDVAGAADSVETQEDVPASFQSQATEKLTDVFSVFEGKQNQYTARADSFKYVADTMTARADNVKKKKERYALYEKAYRVEIQGTMAKRLAYEIGQSKQAIWQLQQKVNEEEQLASNDFEPVMEDLSNITQWEKDEKRLEREVRQLQSSSRASSDKNESRFLLFIADSLELERQFLKEKIAFMNGAKEQVEALQTWVSDQPQVKDTVAVQDTVAVAAVQDDAVQINEEPEDAPIVEEAIEAAQVPDQSDESSLPVAAEVEDDETDLPVVEEPPTSDQTALAQDVPFSNLGQSSAYSDAKPIPIDVRPPDGLVFKIQVGAFRNPIPQDLFKGFAPITGERLSNGITRYTAGLFKEIPPASNAQSQIRELGYRDAFIVAYLNGERISLARARSLISSGDAPQAALGDAGVTFFGGDREGASSAGRSVGRQAAGATLQDRPAVAVETVKGVFYTVQVGAYKRLLTPRDLFGIAPLAYDRLSNGLYRYTSGVYPSRPQANTAKDRIREKGVSDAFVVAYQDGRQVNLARAQQLLQQGAAPAKANTGLQSLRGNNNAAGGNVVFKIVAGPYGDIVPISDANAILEYANIGLDKNEDHPDGIVYMIGSFSNIDDANELLEELQEKGVTYLEVAAFSDGQAVDIDQAVIASNLSTPKEQVQQVDVDVRFSVELGRYEGEVPVEDAALLLELSDRNIQKEDLAGGGMVYTLGNYRTFEEANEIRDEMDELGIKQPEVVAFKDGQRISVDEAILTSPE